MKNTSQKSVFYKNPTFLIAKSKKKEEKEDPLLIAKKKREIDELWKSLNNEPTDLKKKKIEENPSVIPKDSEKPKENSESQQKIDPTPEEKKHEDTKNTELDEQKKKDEELKKIAADALKALKSTKF